MARFTPEQVAIRNTGIGASEVAAVCGLSDFAGPVDIWGRKLGLLPDPQETEAMEAGIHGEEMAARWFAAKTGAKMLTVAEWCRRPEAGERFSGAELATATTTGILRNAATAPIFASVDRFAVFSDGVAVVEIKWVDSRQRRRWGEPGGRDAYPLMYLLQVQAQLFVTGLRTAYLVVVIGGNDLRYYRIERDSNLIRMIVDRCITFWQHVENREHPEKIGSSPAWAKILAAEYPGGGKASGLVSVVPDDDADIALLRASHESLKRAKEYHAASLNRMMARIAGGWKIENNLGTAQIVDRKGTSRTDWKKIRAMLPAVIGLEASASVEKLISENTSTGEPSRYVKFTPSGGGDGDDEE